MGLIGVKEVGLELGVDEFGVKLSSFRVIN